jgi:hypothetical protein
MKDFFLKKFKDGWNYILENPITKPIIFLENIKWYFKIEFPPKFSKGNSII